MNVVIDHGNSRSKIGIFDQHVQKEELVFNNADLLKNFLQNFSGDNLIISTVSQEAATLVSWAKNFSNAYVLSPSLLVPVTNNYATPHTLGMDRLAAICGAWAMFPGQNSLVIDAGTCLTYDIIDNNGVYHGGGISPGLNMRFRAVHEFTARLPLVERSENAPLIGNSTETCIQSGVENGIVEEVNGIIERYSVQFTDLKIILCGGDTAFFEKRLKRSIFAGPNLVLRGLNSILLHNVNR